MGLTELLAALRDGSITPEQLDQLRALVGAEGDDQLTDDQLAEANEALVEAFDAAREASDLAGMRAIAGDDGVLPVVTAEQDARAEAAEAAQAEADELAARVHGDPEADAEGEDDTPEAAADQDAPEDATDAEDDAAPEGSAEGEPEVAEDREPAMAAASQGRRAPLARTRGQASRQPAPRQRQSRARVQAGPELPNHSAGQPMTPGEVGEAFADRFQAVAQLAGRRGATGRFPVARMIADFPEDRQLTQDLRTNQSLIASALVNEEGQSLTAAGGLCAPAAIDYGQMRIDTEARPLRDSLVGFQADRGGITYVPPPRLSDVGVSTTAQDADGSWDDDATAVAGWSETLDTTPGEATKPYQTVVCADPVTVNVGAITKRLRVGNFSRRTFVEQWDAWWGLAGAAHARKAENMLWEAMTAFSRNLQTTHAQQLGITRDLLAGLDMAIAAFRHRNRMSDNATLRVALPRFVQAMIRADLARQLAGDSTYAVTDAQINGWFGARNAAPTWLIDAGDTNVFAAQTAGALVEFPATVEVQIYPEGSFLFLDGGTLDLGVELRDTSLTDTNDVEAFVETFEAVGFVGVDALTVAFSGCADGTAQGTVSATICGS